ncbi:MAG: hypothetical protein ABI824_06635 [Acidobacteriota bacterium]
MEAKQVNLADVLERIQVEEAGNEIIFTTSKLDQMFLKDVVFDSTVKRVAGRPVRVTIKVGEVAAQTSSNGAVRSAGANAGPRSQVDPDVAERAMAHPEVKRFQELFPDSQVRAVRNLKDTN